MANQEHVDRLFFQGAEAWNQWRRENPEIKPDLISADLRHANLKRADLSSADLSNADLFYANLGDVDLSGANLSHASLYYADLSGANLSHADLRFTDLGHVKLNGANLSHAILYAAQALYTRFNGATLTGVYIENWNINAATDLQDVVCEYIFTRYDGKNKQFTNRIPHDPNKSFAPGEFTKRYQIVLETVDLFFDEGIDWKALLASLQDLQAQHGNELTVQGIEKKAGSSFVVRLEVPPETDKGAIERQAKELYETQLQILESRYQERLHLQGEQLTFFKEQVEIERIRNTRLERIVETMAEKESPKYDLRGAKFGGGFAADGGTQTGGTFNDYSQNIEQNINEIGSLIQSLQSLAQAFPAEQRQETLEHLEDIATEIQQPQEKRKVSRMKAALLALLGVATAVSGAVAGANEFATNVQELADKLNIPLPIEQVQSQDAIDVKAVDSDQP